VLTVDAPSDQWSSFSQRFREDPRYGEDVKALLAEAGRRYAIADWTLVGTSEGSISAFHAARMNPALARRLILTASVFIAGRNGPGLSGVDFDGSAGRLLWVHHEADPCAYTPLSQRAAVRREVAQPAAHRAWRRTGAQQDPARHAAPTASSASSLKPCWRCARGSRPASCRRTWPGRDAGRPRRVGVLPGGLMERLESRRRRYGESGVADDSLSTGLPMALHFGNMCICNRPVRQPVHLPSPHYLIPKESA
jgi:pimeloyl-ACP methyl ester carboxylesterase